jgi:hypothetical protein
MLDQSPLNSKRRKPIPFEFVLDVLVSLSPSTRPMFGCLAVYVKEKIVLILRDKPNTPDKKPSGKNAQRDNGVWLCTTVEHHQSLRRDFPDMRSIHVLGKGVTGWQVLPSSAPGFEEAALRACDLIIAGDPRIGKITGARKPKRKIPKSSVRSKKSRG